MRSTLLRMSVPLAQDEDFVAERLTAGQIRLAYPLVREADPAVGLEEWMAFARRCVALKDGAREGVVVTRRRGQTFLSGLFCYRVHRDMRLGSVVTADHFVAVDIIDPVPVLRSLLGALERLAGRLGCAAVRSVMHGREPQLPQLRECLLEAGHVPEGATLCKRLAGPASGPMPAAR